MIPDLRIRSVNSNPLRPGGDYVLYWMTAYRRTRWNFALERAAAIARSLGRPLVVLEALRCDYPSRSERVLAFVVQGMRDNRDALAGSGVLYYPYVERAPGEGRGLIEALGARACAVVTDDWPGLSFPRMIAAAGRALPVRLEAVDSNGLLPLAATDRVFNTAASFRRFLHRRLPADLLEAPTPSPLAGGGIPPIAALPAEICQRWPAADAAILSGHALPAITNRRIGPVARIGGARAGGRALRAFLCDGLGSYAVRSRQAPPGQGSGLSPYLHFGHLSTHQIMAGIAERELWHPIQIADSARGDRVGWWNMSAAAEAFLDQLVTWREMGFNMTSKRPDDYAALCSLPTWAQSTLAAHAGDARAFIYDRQAFENAATHDPIWNAAQRQLVREGDVAPYLRMLWGKKILEWSADPETALAIMRGLNDTYAIDGRDPNSISGIMWVLGRYDRAWGPERPVFGKVRYMSSANTARKFDMASYLHAHGA
jgi:deoxyribodipyrimidine photo-lyase